MTESPEPAIFLDDDVEGEDLEVSSTLADRKDDSPTHDVNEAEVVVEEEEGEGEGLLMADDGGEEEGGGRWRRGHSQTHPLGMITGTSWTSIPKLRRNSNL